MKRLGLVVAALALLVGATGCSSHGWDALPVDAPGHKDCFQVQRYESGWSTKTWAEGTYCKVDVP